MGGTHVWFKGVSCTQAEYTLVWVTSSLKSFGIGLDSHKHGIVSKLLYPSLLHELAPAPNDGGITCCSC